MAIDQAELKRLKDLALAVQERFGGPWRVCDGKRPDSHYKGVSPNVVWEAHPEIANYIAALSPEVVLGLVASIQDGVDDTNSVHDVRGRISDNLNHENGGK